MAASLMSTVSMPDYTKASILMALKTPAGLRTVWIVVEAEDDVRVYGKFVNPDTTMVKTSTDSRGRKGYANVETVVTEVKDEVPKSHILGIRDADYSRYEVETHCFPDNVFATDYRDLEMTLMKSDRVKTAFKKWTDRYDEVLAISEPICRFWGYMRIYNHIYDLSCPFHNKLKITKFWDFNAHALSGNWKEKSLSLFITLVGNHCTESSFNSFVSTHSLDSDDFYNICRGHDLLSILSLALVDVHSYSVEKMMTLMKDAYTLDDFRSTNLYGKIKAWQENEGVKALMEF